MKCEKITMKDKDHEHANKTSSMKPGKVLLHARNSKIQLFMTNFGDHVTPFLYYESRFHFYEIKGVI